MIFKELFYFCFPEIELKPNKRIKVKWFPYIKKAKTEAFE